MAQFIDPFPGVSPERRLTTAELLRCLREDVAAEHEAVHLYLAHADATDDPVARAVLIDIANEERVHVGEFSRLIAILSGDEDAWLAKGASEVDDLAAQVTAGHSAAARGQGEQSTIGSLSALPEAAPEMAPGPAKRGVLP